MKKTIADDPPPFLYQSEFPNLAELRNFSTDGYINCNHAGFFAATVPSGRLTRKNVSSVFPVVLCAFDLRN